METWLQILFFYFVSNQPKIHALISFYSFSPFFCSYVLSFSSLFYCFFAPSLVFWFRIQLPKYTEFAALCVDEKSNGAFQYTLRPLLAPKCSRPDTGPHRVKFTQMRAASGSWDPSPVNADLSLSIKQIAFNAFNVSTYKNIKNWALREHVS